MNTLSKFAYDPNDSEGVRLEKVAILLVSGSCVAAGCVWTAMYFLVFGPGLTTALPLLFVVIVSSSLLVSHISRNIRYAIYTQIVCIIYFPSFVQWSIGGIFDSGIVLTWALCGPIVALIYLPIRKAAFWFALYSVNILITVIFDSYFSSNSLGVDDTTQRIFTLLNILISSLVIFGFAGYFVNKAIAAERTLTGAVESLGEGIAYFDKEDRLKIFNEKFASLTKWGTVLKIGARYDDMVRQRAEFGFADDADFELEEIVEEGLRRHRDPQGRYTTSFADGMWLIVSDSTTEDGGSVIALTDITNLKRAEKELAEKEAQLRAVLDNLPVFICLKDRDMRYIFVNKIFEEWSDARREDIIGKSLSDHYGPKLSAEYEALDQKTITDGTVLAREIVFQYPDGKERTVVSTRFPVASSSGEILGLGTINYDITERKRAEKELAEKEAQLRAVLDNMPGGARYVDKDKNYVFFNSQYSELYNFPEGLLKVGESNRVENLYQAQRGDFGEGDPEKLTDDWLVALPVKTEPTSWERKPIGGKVLQIRTAPTPDGGVVNIVTDITERKQAEEALNSAKKELEIAHRQANDLLLNAIPETIAERLKDNPDQLIADRHKDVSIMFVDVAGFTAMSAGQRPEETVNMLNDLFSDFDDVVEAAGVEKIRTIGDGYMVVGGAPLPLEDHVAKTIKVAQSILDIAQHHSIDIRIGINAGEVVAGIIGTRRFHYDVWGDAVNIAARLETTGEVGKIHICESVADRLPEGYLLEKREIIKMKGKGKMQTWFVEPVVS